MNPPDEVRSAHDRFYAALTRILNGDAAPMLDVWHHDDSVTTSHPFGSWAVGWDQVRANWEESAKGLSNGEVTVSELEIHVHGDIAYTTGVEHGRFDLLGAPIKCNVNTTNIYKRVGGTWKMIHHHSDKVAAAEKAIEEA